MNKFPLLLVVFLSFSIVYSQAEEWTVEDIVFTGNESISKKMLIKRIELKPSTLFRRVSYSFSGLIEAITAIERLYEEKGYLNVSTSIQKIVHDSTNMDVTIYLHIDEGKQATIDSVIIRDAEVITNNAIHSLISLKADTPLLESHLEKAIQIIEDTLRAKGYLLVDVVMDREVNRDNTQATVIFTIQEGPLVQAGDFIFTGLEKVREHVVERNLRFSQGTIVTSSEIAASIRHLLTTNLFKEVRIEPIDTAFTYENGGIVTLPFLIQLQENDMLQLSVIGGYGAYEKLYFRVAAIYKNLFFRAHRISLSSQVSTPVKRVELAYLYPWLLSSPIDGRFKAYLEQHEEETYSGVFDGFRLSVGSQRGVIDFYELWTRYERTEWLREPPPTTTFPDQPIQDIQTFGFLIGKDNRISPIEPGDAFFGAIEAEIGGLVIPSTTNYYKFIADVRMYFLLISSLQYSSALFTGYIGSYGGEPANVPPQELFRIGRNQIRAVRGFDTDEVSPKDEQGNSRGGRVVTILNIFELVYSVHPWINIALFADAGYVWKSLKMILFNDIKWSAGPGIGLDFPIGLIRIDYGIKLNRIPEIDGRFHLNIGLPF
jgi:outer membrane protein assembly complex protein YaeT